MTGYEIYNFCKNLTGRRSLTIEQYLENKSKGFFESLSKFFITELKFEPDEIKDYIKANYNKDTQTFDPFKLMEEESKECYYDWKRNLSTVSLYFETVRKSFRFIETFCINKNITLEQYKQNFAVRHIREKRIDYAVAAHLQLINLKTLNKIEKLLLTDYVKHSKILKVRLSDPDLKLILESETHNMKKLLEECNTPKNNFALVNK